MSLPFLIGLALEGELGSEHGIEGDSQTPDVDEFGVVADLLDDFGGSIGGSSADGFSKFPELRGAAEAEVDEFHVPMLVKQHVFRLDVSMAEAALLEVDEGRQHLVEDACGFLLRNGPRPVYFFEEFPVSAVLHEDVDAGVLADDLVDLRDVLVEEVLLQLDLAHDALQLVLVVLLDGADLHGHCLAGQFVRGLLDLSESAFTDRFF